MNKPLQRALADYDAHQGTEPVKGCRCERCKGIRYERRMSRIAAKQALVEPARQRNNLAFAIAFFSFWGGAAMVLIGLGDMGTYVMVASAGAFVGAILAQAW